jgi:hypothetical protein
MRAAPPNKAAALTPIAGSISGTGRIAAKVVPAIASTIKVSPPSFHAERVKVFPFGAVAPFKTTSTLRTCQRYMYQYFSAFLIF